jgi:hypothetical protein
LTPPVLIVDGVTGAGKTSVIAELRRRLPAEVEFIPEDDTLGDLMDQIRDEAWRAQPVFPALEGVLTRLEKALAENPQRRFLVERFHLTGYALFPEWKWYECFDARLRALGASIVLLTYPPHLAEARSIRRPDREAWDTGMDAYYGSRDAAVGAVLDSQRLRWEGLLKTHLPFLHIDTRTQEWRRCAATVHAYWTAA